MRALADVAPGVAVEGQVQRGRAGLDVDGAGVGDALDGDVAHRAAERAAREGRGGAGLGGDGDARGGLGAAAPVAVVAGGQQDAVAALGAGEHAGEGRGGGVQVRRGGGGRQDEQDGQRDERKGPGSVRGVHGPHLEVECECESTVVRPDEDWRRSRPAGLMP